MHRIFIALGDEMNMHVPQSIQATLELKHLPLVSKQVISPSYNEPIIKPAQDNLLGVYKITDDSVFFNQRDIMNLLMEVAGFNGQLPEPAINEPPTRILWSGKQLFSMILPPISLKTGGAVIDRGILVKGQINKKVSNAIVHVIFSDYGFEVNARYLNNLQKIVIRYMIRSGYSVGMSDIMVHPDVRKMNEQSIVKGKQRVSELTKKIHLNTFDDISHDIDEVYEEQVKGIIGETTKEVEHNTKDNVDADNRMMYMVNAGTKGKIENFMQVSCLVGQQSIDNKRVSLGFSNRSLPHFAKYDHGMESKGFISSSYRDGLTPQEFYFHAMAGREGLIDTAVKTARSGYLQRKLIKATEDLEVKHDYTVRNSNGDIVQFLYGDDGFHPIHLERLESGFKHIFLITEENLRDYTLLNIDDSWATIVTQAVAKELKANSKEVAARFKRYNAYVVEKLAALHATYSKYLKRSEGLGTVAVYFPINFERIIGGAMKLYNLDKTNKCDISPIYILDTLDALVKRCLCFGKTNEMLEFFILDQLAAPRVIKDLRLTRIVFDHIVNAIETRFHKSLVQGGEMVGPLAAQSIGEVSTQLTLRSVDWDTTIIIACDGIIITPMIGRFIDDYYTKMMADPATANKVQHLENNQIYIPLEDGHVWTAFSTDENGVGKWTKLEAITRHPVINEDGSDTILEVEVDSGRTIKATKGKSFLVFDVDQMKQIPTNGTDIKVGDLLTVISNFVMGEGIQQITHLDMRQHLPPQEYIHGTQVNNALRYITECEARGDNKLWSKGNNVEFIVPYARGDSFRAAYIGGKKTMAAQIVEGYIYEKNSTKQILTKIPEQIPLDEPFGYFCGAYMADGMANELRIIIAKHDDDFIRPIVDLLATWNIGYRKVVETKKEATADHGAWKSTNHIFQSVMFAQVLGNIFGFTSDDKVIPGWVLQAPNAYLRGFISGYFSGDGSVDKDGVITVGSVGFLMLEMIALILKRFEINTTVRKSKQDRKRFPNAKEYIYNLYIPKIYNAVFARTFTLTIAHKRERLATYLDKGLEPQLRYLECNDIIAVEIKTIKEIRPMEIDYDGVKQRWVYDLTVAETRNFTSGNGMTIIDTFHSSGSAAGSSVNQGVPRLDELLNKQVPKKTKLQVALTEEYRQSLEKADEIRYNIELVKISDILLSDAIYAEASNKMDDVLEEDRAIMKIYEIFSELDQKFKQIPQNPWVIRLEFNRREMIKKKITMEDISIIIQQNMPHAIIVFADDNAGKMIFRIRINFDSDTTNADNDLNLLSNEIENIKNITIKGVEGIQAVYVQKNANMIVSEITPSGTIYKAVTEYYLDTAGSNLAEILVKPYVDAANTLPFDIIETYHVLGIEAARWLLEDQFHAVFNGVGKNVCPRHVGLVSDLMTCKGKIMAANRNGINNSDIGPFAKISFEETIRQLKEAGLFGKYDNMEGVSSNIMFGQIPACGTGDSEILLDEEIITAYMLEHPEAANQHMISVDEYGSGGLEAAFGSDPYCDENQDINFNFSAIEGDIVDISDMA